MNTNNPSDKNRVQNLEQDANESANDSKNVNDVKNADKNRMQQSSESGIADRGDYRSGKGTGMSNEAGSAQSEKSWQGTGGSQPGTSENRKYSNEAGTGNNNNDNQRQSSGSNKNDEEGKNQQQEWNKSNKQK